MRLTTHITLVPYSFLCWSWKLYHSGEGRVEESRVIEMCVAVGMLPFSSRMYIAGSFRSANSSPLAKSNVIDTETFCAQFNERNWFSHLYVTRIVARIDSLILVEFAALSLRGLKEIIQFNRYNQNNIKSLSMQLLGCFKTCLSLLLFLNSSKI